MRTASSLAAYMHRKVGSWASFQWDDGARPLSATPSSTSDEALLGSDDLEAGPGGDGSEKVASRASTSTAFPPRSGTWSGTWRARAGGDKGAESPLGGWARLVVVLLVGFVFGRHFSGQRPELLRTARAGDVREGLWSEYGNDELSVVGTKEEVDLSLPICERTMLIDWSTFGYGFGSTAVSVMQSATFAKIHGYTLVFSRGANSYGSYFDLFEPAKPTDCRLTEELHQPEFYRIEDSANAPLSKVAEGRPPQLDGVKRILAGSDAVYPINYYIRDATFDMPALDSLPALDSSRPKPGADLVPAIFQKRFSQWSSLTHDHFTFNAVLKAKLERALWELGLDKARSQPVVGVHWRGGDKLRDECKASSQMSCGNVTLHCENAYEALDTVAHDYPSFDRTTSKARLLLMTTEPDALSLFRSDPMCRSHFDVEELPRGGSNKAFLQEDFRHLSKEDRLDDTQRMLVQTEILASHVDAAVVSANSNTGRALILLRGGPARVVDEHRIRSVDLYWHPVQFPVFKGRCDGTWGGCWPE
ncbi:hypothetical protein DMC30DRAFT_417937 [Rhodotorula diobovata]|uniref:Uncharacterized protein n=1 Tax=Rhodotorula diobovata TaxID=5288 RepID=A0A5C5FRE5_9BASI|nr:hypothetical protein DMC30DRAFT_417937 [Rhodotorula diobovata]